MRLSKIQVLFLIVALFGNIFFFSFYALTGRVYYGASSDNTYMSFMMIVDIVPLLLFLRYLGVNKSKKNVGSIVLAMAFILIILLIEARLDFSYPLIKAFLSYSIPAALVGVLIAKYDAGDSFAKWLEPMMIMLTLVGIRSMSIILQTSYYELRNAGIGAQSLSYHCGFAFALNLYFLLFGDEHRDRFNYAKSKFYQFIAIALLVVQVIVSLSTGGRGGFVLIVISTLALFSMKAIRRGGSMIKTLFLFFLMTIMAVIAIEFMPEDISNAVGLGSERTFSYLTKEGIDMSETSNRDDVYGRAIIDFAKQPIFGYGLLMKGSFIEGSWPHNIVLEVLLQGGIIYLLLFVFVIIRLVRKLRIMIKTGHKLYIIPLVLYPFTMLCFSGSYITTGLFWFVLSYVFCYENKKRSSGLIN